MRGRIKLYIVRDNLYDFKLILEFFFHCITPIEKLRLCMEMHYVINPIETETNKICMNHSSPLFLSFPTSNSVKDATAHVNHFSKKFFPFFPHNFSTLL